MRVFADKIAATFENAVFYDNKLWFTEYDCNEFYYYDICSQETVLVCKLEKEEEYGQRLFYTIIPYNNNMYLIPFSASKLYKVNILDKTVNEIDIAEPSYELRKYYHENAKFVSAHLYAGKIYLIPASYPAILEYDCNSGKTVYYADWVRNVEKKFVISGSAFFRKTLLLNKKIYMPLCKGNAVAIYDIDKKIVDVKVVGNSECTYSSICYDGQRFWLSPRNKGPIICWKEEECKYKEYDQFPAKYIKLQGSYGDIIYHNGEVLLIPMSAAMVLRVNVENGSIKKYKLENKDVSYMCQCRDENNLYLFSIQTCQLYTVDTNSTHIKKCYIYLPVETEKYHRKHLSTTYQVLHKNQERKSEVLLEIYEDALTDYLQYVCQIMKD